MVIQALEAAGKAEPLSTSGHYDQYLAKWKTDAAYIFIANWSAHWSKDILEAYAAQYVAASGVLSTKALKDAAIGSMVDYTLQVGLNWAFFAKDDATIEEIAKDVDFYQIAASGAENAFSSSLGNQRTQVLLSASISCMFDGSFEDGNLRRDFNLEECAKGIASAVIANQVSNFALAKLQNLDAERLKRGLLRLGIPQKEWTRFLRWLGIKNADHVAKGADNLTTFVNKTLTQKLDDISNAWKAVYPEIFVERRLFEDIMGHYRYPKNFGWGHTADIAHNFKAVDFYDNFTIVGNDIFAKTAISMKSTTTKSVDAWLGTNAVKNNIDNLKNAVGSGAGKGITWNGKTVFYNKAEIHIYMPKENITPALKTEWLNKLATEHPTIKFEINSLEDFIK